MDEEVESELLALESIYEDKLAVEDSSDVKNIKITIYPATADNISSQYVCLEILFTLPKSYPINSPQITFTMSRGLSDFHLDELLHKMKDFAQERIGECILFDLMEMAKDILTSNNVPNCPCSICLMSFHECDDFLKTECYHYFHSYCMNQYFIHQQEGNEGPKPRRKGSQSSQVPCPVCRLQVVLNIRTLQEAQAPLNEENFDDIEESLAVNHMREYEGRFRKQLMNGGLIDLEQEKNKYLLSNIEKTYAAHKESTSETEKCDKEEVSSSKLNADLKAVTGKLQTISVSENKESKNPPRTERSEFKINKSSQSSRNHNQNSYHPRFTNKRDRKWVERKPRVPSDARWSGHHHHHRVEDGDIRSNQRSTTPSNKHRQWRRNREFNQDHKQENWRRSSPNTQTSNNKHNNAKIDTKHQSRTDFPPSNNGHRMHEEKFSNSFTKRDSIKPPPGFKNLKPRPPPPPGFKPMN